MLQNDLFGGTVAVRFFTGEIPTTGTDFPGAMTANALQRKISMGTLHPEEFGQIGL